MMTNKKYLSRFTQITLLTIILVISACKRDVDDLDLATFPANGDVFIDGFSAGLEYAAFGGSKLTAFEVDNDVTYEGSASMRFEVPDVGDPGGAYAGGAYFVGDGRDLSGFDALTFWAKASQAATIDVVGFGNDLAELKYQVSLTGVAVNSNWKKYIIPIPDPSKLTQEKGMFYYSEGPENGTGYTFWIDEVKFEKLGTIAQPEPGIEEYLDKTITVETGQNISVGGLVETFNLADGSNQTVNLAPSYFTFVSSETSVATVNSLGELTILDEGSATITAKLGELDALGSLTIESTGEALLPSPAPVPTVDPSNVISMFSNAYTNVPIDTWNTGWEFSTAETDDVQVDGDDMKRYRNLNFVGIEFASQTIDASLMTHFHMDIWTPDPTDLPASFKVLLIDFGADGVFDGGDDSSHELSFTSPTLTTGAWVSIDVPLSNFAGLSSRANLAQLVLSGELPNVFVDNVYYYIGDDTSTTPTVAAPTPTQDPANVISVFSDAYTNIPGTDFNPDWGQTTAQSEVSIAGNNTLLYSGLNYQGTVLGSSQDVSGMTHLHVDFWTDNSSELNAFLISSSAEESSLLTVPTSGWASVDIPLSNFSSVDLTDIIQLKFDGNGNIYLDNIYFYSESTTGGTEPTTAAPSPTHDAANVISVFSDTYANINIADFNPNWGQSGTVNQVDVAGNNTLKYDNFNYQGTDFAGSEDMSTMTFVHIDMWTADATDVQFTPISTGTGEFLVGLTPISSGQWNSYDIPLTDFIGVSFNDIVQLKFDGQAGSNPSNIWLDNIYFYTTGPPPTEPTTAAPSPTHDAASVISVFSDAYTNINIADFNPNWGQSGATNQVDVAGNNTLKYDNFNYQGTDFAGSEDMSTMQFVHIDMWTADATNVQFTPIGGGAEFLVGLNPINSGQWNSYDIPLTDFTGVSFNDVTQLKFDGQAGANPSNIWLDNIYFYTTGSTGVEPSLPLDFENGETLIAFDNGATAANIPNPNNAGNPSANVLEFKKVVGSAWYSGVVFDETLTTTPIIDLSNGTVFTMKIWSPIAGVNVRFQLEGGLPNAGTTPAYEVFQTVNVANQWVTLTFDFTSQVSASSMYSKFSIFPDFNTGNQVPVAVEAIYYIDDIIQQ